MNLKCEDKLELAIYLLEEAIVEISDWGAYASPYFQEKWELENTLAKFRRQVAMLKGEYNDT